MTRGGPLLVSPPGRWRVMAAGLATARRRPGAQPILPGVTLALRDPIVEARQVEEYAAVCGFAADHGVPATFPHILAFPLHMALMMRRGFPFPMAGTVHIANRIEQREQLVIGDRLGIRARCGGLVAHPRGQAFTIDVAITRGGRPVWSSISTYLHRGRHPGAGSPILPLPDPPEPGDEAWRGTATRRTARDYARLSGDRNPIHTSMIGARLFGFPRPIAHGMWSLARAVAALPPTSGKARIDAAFRAAVPLPADLLVRADAAGRVALVGARDERLHLSGAVTC